MVSASPKEYRTCNFCNFLLIIKLTEGGQAKECQLVDKITLKVVNDNDTVASLNTILDEFKEDELLDVYWCS